MLIQALRNDEWSVQCRAYNLLQENAELGLKQALRAYNPYLLKCLHTIFGHSSDVYSVAFSPNGRTLASSCWNHTIKLWDVETGELKNTLTEHSSDVYSVAFSPNGRTLASSSWDHTINLWDVETGELKNTLTGHSSSVYSVAFSPDGRTLASGSSDKTIKLWDVETGEPKSTLTGHLSYVDSVAFSPDGRTLASCSSDKTIKLWDVETGEPKSTLTGHSRESTWSGQAENWMSVAFSPDGWILASASGDKTIKLWGKENSTQFKQEPVEFFHRYLALKEALKSGESGLDLLITSLKDESWSVRQAAYWLLRESEEPEAKQALQEYRTSLSVTTTNIFPQLEFLLAVGDWKEAEEETENILLKISGCARGTDPQGLLKTKVSYQTLLDGCTVASDLTGNIPDQILRDICALWENSNGCSSFNEQKSSLVFWLELKQQIESFFQRRSWIKSDYDKDQRDAVQSVYGGDN